MKNYLRPVAVFTRMNLLRFLRDKMYIFFMLILPVMFLVIFGMIYGGEGFSSFKVAIFDEAGTEMSRGVVEGLTVEDGMMERVEVGSRGEAGDKLVQGSLVGIITLPEGFGVPGEDGVPRGEIDVMYGGGNEQAGQALSAMLGSVAAELTAGVSGLEPNFTVKAEALNRTGLTNFDYVFAGLLGYTVLSIGLMGIANILPGDKESGATKRLRATTATPGQLIISYALTFLAIGVVSFAIMIALGLMVFNFNMRGSWINFTVFTSIATMMMLGFGLAVGGWARNEAQASVLGNLLMFPMMFLSGVFFPLFLMPGFVQAIARFMPLTPVVDGIRLIITENYSLIDVMPQLAVIGVWAVVIYAVAIKSFRWD